MALETGQTVVIVMTANDWFPWQTGPSFKATFESGPQGPGDTLKVVVPGNDRSLHLNMNSSAFVGMYLDGPRLKS